ncbi:MAG: hypothetical protein AAF821_18070 [Cyanobacteria bacterium P01_D01_bin.156]
MFELYFGAFDILLYGIAFVVSIHVANVLCDQAEQAQMVPPLATVNEAPCPTVERRCVAPRPIAAIAVTKPPVKVIPPATVPMTMETDSQEPTVTNEEMTVDTVVSTTEAASQLLDKPMLQLADIKIYKLHKKSVVKVSDLPFDVPENVKRYSLRGEPALRLEALEKAVEVVS